MMNRSGDVKKISFDEIRELMYDHAETGFKHTTYQEETRRFNYLVNGDKRAVRESVKMMNPDIQGTLSKNPVRNIRYLFIVNTGLATRYLIEAGIPQETVYSTSDLYIQKADKSTSIEEIIELNRKLWTVLVSIVREHKKESLYSRPVLQCLNYIDSHFNEKICLENVAEEAGLNPCYLATLFKKETGKTFGNYLTDIRIETAKTLLIKTDYSYSEIAYSLAFCSQSHFTKTFRNRTGYTPRKFRMEFYNVSLSAFL